MAQTTLFDDQGRQIALGKELGRGGEATVYEVEGDRTSVAKIYHRQPDNETMEKLARMVELRNDRLLKLAAWPLATLRSRRAGLIDGMLMRNVAGFKDVHLLYNPKSRTRQFPPKANWAFLVYTAANIARAFSVIHEYKHVIGDVNQSNVLVSPESAVVSLIDCDSFQVFSQGRYFPCEVGVPLYTPPELQHVSQFKSVIRTPNHDNFGLAVLIFHLLFMGRHPFAGRFLGKGDMPPEKAIAEYRFAFAPDQQRTQMQPPPNSLMLDQVSPEVRAFFIQAFAPSGAQTGRPDETQWILALDALGRQLKQCPVNRNHAFYRPLSTCPWCAIETNAGVLLFVGYAVTAEASVFKLELVWAQIASVQNPGPPTLPDFQQLCANVRASDEARAVGWRRRGRITLIVLVTLFVLAVMVGEGLDWLAFWGAIGCVFGVRKLAANARVHKSAFEAEARSSEARVRATRDRWDREASEQPFVAKLCDLKQLAEKHGQLPNRQRQMIGDLQRDLYNGQLRHYLGGWSIASATIPHVKDGRKALLSAYGIDTAADVTFAAVQNVPGFGQFLTEHMLNWRKSIEARFRFDPKRGIDPLDLDRVKQEISKQRREIELALSRGHLELADIRRRIVMARGQLRDELQRTWMEMAQAQANARAA